MLSGVLVICMVFGMLPVGYAADSTTTNAEIYVTSGEGTSGSPAYISANAKGVVESDLYYFLLEQFGKSSLISPYSLQYGVNNSGSVTTLEPNNENTIALDETKVYIAKIIGFNGSSASEILFFRPQMYYKLNVSYAVPTGESITGTVVVNAGGGTITPKCENEYHIFLSDHLSSDDTVSVTLPVYDAEKYTRTVMLNGAVQTVSNNMLNWSMESSCDLSISYEVQQPSAVTCKVAYDYNGGDGALTEQTVTVGGVYGEAAKAAPTRTGYTFAGWKYGDEIITENSEVKTAEDHTLVAQWSPISYQIAYSNLEDGTLPESRAVSYNIESADITLPAPIRTGYDFTGWTWDGNAAPQKNVVIAQGSTGDRTYTANWIAKSYGLTFENVTGDAYQSRNVAYGTALNVPNPKKAEHVFDGWLVNGNAGEIPATMPDYNLTLTATWTANQYTIQFDSNGGSETAPITQAYGTTVTAPENPEKQGYSFSGWEPELPKTMPSGGLSVKAKWTAREYEVQFYEEGGDTEPCSSKNVAYGNAVGALPVPAERQG